MAIKKLVPLSPQQRYKNIIRFIQVNHPLVARTYGEAEVVRCDQGGVTLRFSWTAMSGGILGDRAVAIVRHAVDAFFGLQGIPFEVALYRED